MIVFKVVVNDFDVQFSYGATEEDLKPIGEIQNMNVLSFRAMDFNEPYIGMYATSNGETSKVKALFEWFEYKGN